MQRRTHILGLLIVNVLLTVGLMIPAQGQAGIKLHNAKKAKLSFMSGGQSVEVWEYSPAKGTGPFPGVLSLYGLDGIDDEFKKTALIHDTVCGKIADAGFVVHFVHFFDRTKPDIAANQIVQLKDDLHKLLIDNNGPPPEKITGHYRDWMSTVADGLERLAADSNVDKKRLGMLGVSLGGFLSTSLAVDKPNPNVKAIVNVFGALPPQQYVDVRKNKIKIPPVLLMAGEDDEIVPEKLSRDLLELLRTTGSRGAEAHFYPTGHVFFDKQLNAIDMDKALGEGVPTAVRFLKRHLQTVKVEKK